MAKFTESFRLKTEWKEAQVSTGAELFISNEDARALLLMTEHVRPADSEDYMQTNEMRLHQSRDFVRRLAKRILYTDGLVTSQESLLEKFIGVEKH